MSIFPRTHYVILHIDQGPNVGDYDSEPPIGVTRRFDLTEHIWIERLNPDLAKLIIKACQPAHHNINIANNDDHLYAWLRREPSQGAGRYDALQPLLTAIALSRLVHPSNTGFRYCAWVSDIFSDNPTIHATPFRAMSLDILLGPNARSWLTEADGLEVRALMGWLPNKMYDRVHRAFWNHEYAMRCYELDIRWPLIVGGLESLVNTETGDAAWQFRDRVIRLAQQFGISLSDDDLQKAYKVRSKLVHAERFLHSLSDELPIVQQPVLYQKLEDLLRVMLKTCLLDPAFNHHFKDDISVRKQWPLRAKPKFKAPGRTAK